jgi:hypothetical protein
VIIRHHKRPLRLLPFDRGIVALLFIPNGLLNDFLGPLFVPTGILDGFLGGFLGHRRPLEFLLSETIHEALGDSTALCDQLSLVCWRDTDADFGITWPIIIAQIKIKGEEACVLV